MDAPLTREQQKLVAENHNLIFYLLSSKNWNADLYYDVAAIGLCKAAAKYDESRGMFSTYAMNVMTNEVLMAIRREQAKKRKCRTVSLHEVDIADPNPYSDPQNIDWDAE